MRWMLTFWIYAKALNIFFKCKINCNYTTHIWWVRMCVCLSVCMVKRRNVKENQLSLLFNLAKKIVLYILFTLVSKKRCLPLRVFNFQCFKFTWKLAMKKKVEKSNWEKKNVREKRKNGFNDNKHLLRIRSNYFIISENGKCPTNLFQIRSILLL